MQSPDLLAVEPAEGSRRVVRAESEGRKAEEALAQELVERARTEGVDLVGPGGFSG